MLADDIVRQRNDDWPLFCAAAVEAGVAPTQENFERWRAVVKRLTPTSDAVDELIELWKRDLDRMFLNGSGSDRPRGFLS